MRSMHANARLLAFSRDSFSRVLRLLAPSEMIFVVEKDASRLDQYAGTERERRHGHFLPPERPRACLHRTLEETGLQLLLLQREALDSSLHKVHTQRRELASSS